MWDLKAHPSSFCLYYDFRRFSKLVVTIFSSLMSLKARDLPAPTENFMNENIDKVVSCVCFIPCFRVNWH